MKYPKSVVGDEQLEDAYRYGVEVGENYSSNPAGLKGFMINLKYEGDREKAFLLGTKKGLKENK